MKETTYFKLLRWGAGIWVRRHCNVIYYGLENLGHNKKEKRIYIIDHPTTYDAFILMHISEDLICFVMNDEAFGYPLIGKLLAGAGYIPLVKGKGNEAIERAAESVKRNIPLMYALKSRQPVSGGNPSPRTGGIRVAHAAKATIYPLCLMIEDRARIVKEFRGPDLKKRLYSKFSKTLYLVNFCKPISYEEYAGENMTYEDYQKVALSINNIFDEEKKRVSQRLEDEKEYFSRLKKTGGAEKRITM